MSVKNERASAMRLEIRVLYHKIDHTLSINFFLWSNAGGFPSAFDF